MKTRSLGAHSGSLNKTLVARTRNLGASGDRAPVRQQPWVDNQAITCFTVICSDFVSIILTVFSLFFHCPTVIATIAICLFPLWPSNVREYVWYLSVLAAVLVGAILVLALCTLKITISCGHVFEIVVLLYDGNSKSIQISHAHLRSHDSIARLLQGPWTRREVGWISSFLSETSQTSSEYSRKALASRNDSAVVQLIRPIHLFVNMFFLFVSICNDFVILKIHYTDHQDTNSPQKLACISYGAS